MGDWTPIPWLHVSSQLYAFNRKIAMSESYRAEIHTTLPLILAADAHSVRLPENSVEPRPNIRRTPRFECAILPVRLPGQHLHPHLRRRPWDSPRAERGAANETALL